MNQLKLSSFLSSLLILLSISCSKPIDCSIHDCFGEYYNGNGKFAPKCDEIDAIFFQSDYKNGTGWVKKNIDSNMENVMFHNYKPYTGKVKKCNENGLIITIITFKNGINDGEAFWYHNNGLLKTKITYKNNFLVGERIDYSRNGMISEKGIYWNNMKNSKWYIYNENGRLIKVSIHKGDKNTIGEEIYSWGEYE